MELQLVCECCKSTSEFENSLLAWEEGWELDGVRICPSCSEEKEKKEKHEDVSHTGHTQPCGLDRTSPNRVSQAVSV